MFSSDFRLFLFILRIVCLSGAPKKMLSSYSLTIWHFYFSKIATVFAHLRSCTSPFSASKIFSLWIFCKYGGKYASVRCLA